MKFFVGLLFIIFSAQQITAQSNTSCTASLDIQGNFFPQLSADRVKNLLSTAMGIPTSVMDVTVSSSTATDGSTIFYLTTKAISDPMTALFTLVKKIDSKDVSLVDIDIQKLDATSGGIKAPIYQYKVVEAAPKLIENNMWWLIFLVLLLPVISILVRQAYRKGKKRERRRNQDAARNAIPMGNKNPIPNTNGGYGVYNNNGYGGNNNGYGGNNNNGYGGNNNGYGGNNNGYGGNNNGNNWGNNGGDYENPEGGYNNNGVGGNDNGYYNNGNNGNTGGGPGYYPTTAVTTPKDDPQS
eukprot:PhF_6_TR33609/c5_g1_i4/m.49076